MIKRSTLKLLQISLIGAGLCGVGYYLYSISDQYVYQSYQSWALDQQIRGRKKPETAPVSKAARGDSLGRIEIPRLNVSTMVREGVDAETLSVSAGHVPSTAFPDQAGNFVVAAHRDTLFRAIRNVRRGDVVTFESPHATYQYEVEATKIVDPSDVSVLAPNGGGIMLPLRYAAATRLDSERLLTLITCYPFYFIGPAPKRFIVEARMIKREGS